MKYILLIVILLIPTLSILGQNPDTQMRVSQQSFAQKPVIDTAAFGKWNFTGPIAISHDGHYVLYTINNIPAGSSTLVIQSTDSAWSIDFPGATRAAFTTDSKRAVFMTKGDSLAFLLLGGKAIQYIPDVNSYQIPKEGQDEWMVYRLHRSVGPLVLHNWITNREFIYASVSNYLLSPHGTALLVEKEDFNDIAYPHEISWVNVEDGHTQSIWAGLRAMNLVIDDSDRQAAFYVEDRDFDHTYNAIWYYTQGIDRADEWLTDSCKGLDPGLTFYLKEPLRFSPAGDRLFFSLIRKRHASPPPVPAKADSWSHHDEILKSGKLALQQQEFQQRSVSFAAMAHIGDTLAIRLENDNEQLSDTTWVHKDGHTLLLANCTDEYRSGKTPLPTAWMVSTRDGSRTLLKDSISSWASLDLNTPSSPHDKWFIWFDSDRKNYFSDELATGIRRNITRAIPVSLITKSSEEQGKARQNAPAGIGAWLASDAYVFLYDEYDIWQVDPAGKRRPVNITHGYGRTHHIKFRLLLNDSARLFGLTPDSTLLLSAFDPIHKLNGFYQIALEGSQDPVLLNMEPCLQSVERTQTEDANLNNCFRPLKARDANVWIIEKMTASESPNYYVTRDFSTFQVLTDLHPERAYNWFTTELVNWTLPDGKPAQGILYKPEDFDPQLKYPLLFSIYEQYSDNLHHFIAPQIMIGAISIPWFVSRGYLVFVPDIHYRLGYPGRSALDAVVSAAAVLSKEPWVNSERLGITGHSFGGFETNYIITHTHLFAAAEEAAGLSDLISFYSGLASGEASAQPYFETGQGRIGASLAQRPDLYFENSPIFSADQVTTPILMMHNSGDRLVRFEQGLEFYTGLRQLGKKAWMLQYEGGRHELRSMPDAVDYSTRLTEFFDYYLKDAPLPKWMTEEVSVP